MYEKWFLMKKIINRV